MPEDMSVNAAIAAFVDIVPEVDSAAGVPDKNDVTRTSHRVPRPSYDDLPDNPIDLRAQIRLVSKRLRRSAIPHKEFMDLNKLLRELRNELKARQSRSSNGVNLKAIQRKEARERREALAANKGSDHAE